MAEIGFRVRARWACEPWGSRDGSAWLFDLQHRYEGLDAHGDPLTARQEAANKTRSSVRARVEHVFGSQHTSMGGKLVRTIGIVRANMKIGMQNLAYNMRRLVILERSALAAG